MTPSRLAEHMGWSARTAQRRMLAIEAIVPGTVRRVGKRGTMVALASKLAPYIHGLRETPLEREVRLLREQTSELAQRLDAEVAARLTFQRQANDWFATRGRRVDRTQKETRVSGARSAQDE